MTIDCRPEHLPRHFYTCSKATQNESRELTGVVVHGTDNQLAPEDEADGIEVAWEDQQKINTFSKLNNRLGELRDQLKVKEVRFQ